MEEWRDIKGYEGLYQVSNEGRIKSLERIIQGCSKGGYFDKLLPEKIMKQQCNKYVTVMLCKQGVTKRLLVHRLVAEAFIPNTNNLPQVNHKDECKTNNTIENLEWCTKEYNNNYGTKNDRIRKAALKNYKLRERDAKGRFI